MPFILVIIGAGMVISAARGTQGKLGEQLAADFTGQKSFINWIIAILAIGAIGYVPGLKRFSDGLLGMILLTFLLSNTGVFASLRSAAASPPQSLATYNPSNGDNAGDSGSSSGSTLAVAGALA